MMAQPARARSNAEVAAAFDEIADLLEVQGANVFRIRAYRNAARLLTSLRRSVADMVQAGEDLDRLQGIGKDLAGKIAEIVASGTCAQLEALRHGAAAGLVELLRLPGLGPRRVQFLHDALGVTSLADLREAALHGRIRELRGFGEATQKRLLEAANQSLSRDRRFLLPVVAEAASALLARLKAVPGVHEAVAAGSLRRSRETVGDLDLLVTSTEPGRAVSALTSGTGVARVLAGGGTRASVVLDSGLQVDLRVVAPESFGAAWIYFTGSKAHNIMLRKLAQERGLKLNEYGLYQEGRSIAGSDEASVYNALGLRWIDPELREERGEIEAARSGKLPALVTPADLRGDLHVDAGANPDAAALRALADAAIARGLRYVAVTGRLRTSGGPPGLDAAGLARRNQCIDELNATLRGFSLLKGIEAEIGQGGDLDLPAGIDLSDVDLVTGSVDRWLDLPAARQTDRLRRAMDHPRFSILAHPTNRLLLQRGPSAFDMDRVLRHARERGCFLELSGLPQRLDLDDVSCTMARDAGVLISLSSNAQTPLDFRNLDWGVAQARRGWLEPHHVLNTRPLRELRRLLAATMTRRASEAAID